MNAITQHVETNRISSKAMLVDLRVSQWTARKTDKRAAAEVAASHNAAVKAATVYKSLIDSAALDKVKEVVTAARTYHYKMTLPWSDAGPRVLSSKAYFDYMEGMQKYAVEFQTAVDVLLKDYPLHRQEAKRMLGTLFDDNEYPNLAALQAKFAFNLSVLPLPTGGDFRVELDSDEVELIRQEIEASTGMALRQAVVDAYQRVAKVVNAYIDRLAKPDTIFRDSLVDNACELADILPGLNFADDPHLEAIATKLREKLCAYEPSELRENPVARRETYQAAIDVNKDLMNFFGGAL